MQHHHAGWPVALVLLLGVLLGRGAVAELPLPSSEIPLLSPQGQKLLLDATPRADYFQLAQHFTTQINSAFCGVATSAMLLNALGTPRPAPDIAAGFVNPAYGYYDQTNVFNNKSELVVPKASVLLHGMAIQELSGFLASHPGVGSAYTRTSPASVSLGAFRQSIITALSLPRAYVVVNFDRGVIMEYGGGHHSPVAAYHSASDSVLVLDVSRYKYPAWWVSVPSLYRACSETVDSSTDLTRGLVFAWAQEQYPGATALPADAPSNEDNGFPPVVASVSSSAAVLSGSAPAPQGLGPGAATCLALGMLAAGALLATLATAWWQRGRHQRLLCSLSSIMHEGDLSWPSFASGGLGTMGKGLYKEGGGLPFPGSPGGGAARRHGDDGEDCVWLIGKQEPPV